MVFPYKNSRSYDDLFVMHSLSSSFPHIYTMWSLLVLSLFSFFLTAESLAIEQRSCSSPEVVAISQQVSHPHYFCAWYLSEYVMLVLILAYLLTQDQWQDQFTDSKCERKCVIGCMQVYHQYRTSGYSGKESSRDRKGGTPSKPCWCDMSEHICESHQ
jgi:hypothetical protein